MSRIAAGSVAAMVIAAAGATIATTEQGRALVLQANADLAITWSKTPNTWRIAGGTTVRYVITVSNHGPNAANGIELNVGLVTEKATMQLRASKSAGKTGGAILVAAMTVASEDADDPDEANSTLIFDENDAIQYSILGTVGGGSTTPRKIRAKVLIAPFGSQSQSSVRYRRVEVFPAPPGSP